MADYVASAFGAGMDFYSILGVDKDVTDAGLKTAFRASALKYHPDKNRTDPHASEKFQAISFVHSVLSNAEKRQLYDESGEYDEQDDLKENSDSWLEYWRTLFPKINLRDIDTYATQYRGSDEEKQDILEAYTTTGGNFKNIIEHVMFSESPEEQLYILDFLQSAIEKQDIPSLLAFQPQSIRRNLKASIKKKGKSTTQEQDLSILTKLIQSQRQPTKRATEFNSLVDNLERKYSSSSSSSSRRHKKAKKAKNKNQPSHLKPPTEAEFEAAQKRLKR